MKKYSLEITEFISENVKGKTTKELVIIVNEKFGTEFTESSMKSYKTNHKLKSGTPLGLPSGRPTELFPLEIAEFIAKNHIGVGPKEMTELLNKTFGTNYSKTQLKSYYGNHDINSGLTGCFSTGHIPLNKGQRGYHAPGSEKGWFKKGQKPINHKQVGSERVDVDGYTLVKTEEPNVWQFKHKIIWEEKNGAVPEGHVLTFLDGNKANIALENIKLITMHESMELNRGNLRSNIPEYTETGILIAKVRIAASRQKKKVV